MFQNQGDQQDPTGSNHSWMGTGTTSCPKPAVDPQPFNRRSPGAQPATWLSRSLHPSDAFYMPTITDHSTKAYVMQRQSETILSKFKGSHLLTGTSHQRSSRNNGPPPAIGTQRGCARYLCLKVNLTDPLESKANI